MIVALKDLAEAEVRLRRQKHKCTKLNREASLEGHFVTWRILVA